MVSVAIAIFSSVFSGLIAILATVAIEKLGGTMGGVLATTPTTILPFSFALALSGASYDSITSTMFSVPVGICLTSLYLLLWREVPRLSLVARLPSSCQQLSLVLPLLLSFWVGGACLLVYLLPLIEQAGVSIVVVGVTALLLSFTIGVAVIFSRDVPAPTGKRSVTAFQYLSRGLLAGSTIGLSLVISSVSPVAGGVASVFPSVTTTTMVMLWVQQGREVPAGAAGPMMLGNGSVSSFCLLFALLYPAMDLRGVPLPLTLTAVCLVCWVLATVFVSVPIFALLHWRKGRRAEQVEAQAAARDTDSSDGAKEEEDSAELEKGHSLASSLPLSSRATDTSATAWSQAVQAQKKEVEEELKQPLTAA